MAATSEIRSGQVFESQLSEAFRGFNTSFERFTKLGVSEELMVSIQAITNIVEPYLSGPVGDFHLGTRMMVVLNCLEFKRMGYTKEPCHQLLTLTNLFIRVLCRESEHGKQSIDKTSCQVIESSLQRIKQKPLCKNDIELRNLVKQSLQGLNAIKEGLSRAVSYAVSKDPVEVGNIRQSFHENNRNVIAIFKDYVCGISGPETTVCEAIQELIKAAMHYQLMIKENPSYIPAQTIGWIPILHYIDVLCDPSLLLAHHIKRDMSKLFSILLEITCFELQNTENIFGDVLKTIKSKILALKNTIDKKETETRGTIKSILAVCEQYASTEAAIRKRHY